MKLKLFIVASSVICVFAQTSDAQQLSYSDAAQAYNRILLEKGNGTYQRISTYKVQGTQYLFGEKHPGDMFAAGETAYNIHLSYNTYNQEVEFYSSSNPTKPLAKSAKDVDSFKLKPGADQRIAESLLFINGKHLKADNKTFYQLVTGGNKISLYKKYKSTLGIVTTNYIDADLRQFNLEFEYFYFDEAAKELKKIKLNDDFIKKTFKEVKNINDILERNSLVGSPEVTLKEIFFHLNQ